MTSGIAKVFVVMYLYALAYFVALNALSKFQKRVQEAASLSASAS